MPGVLTQPFVPIPRVDIDHASPLLWTTFRDLRDLQEHVRLTGYDPATHTPTEAHDHDGLNSSLIILPSTPNLIADSDPTSEGRRSVNEWSRSDVDLANEGLKWDGAGYATHVLGDKKNSAQGKRQFGGGTPLVLCVSLRASVVLTSLDFRLGVSDGHTSTAHLEASFTHEQIGTGWSRFFTYLSDFDPSSFTKAPRMLLRVASMAPTGDNVAVVARIIVAKPATVLPWYEPGHDVTRQHNWELIGWNNTPNWDQEMSFDRAIFGEAA